jgi:hypothetical protein
MKFAEELELKVMKRPENFSMFETDIDRQKEEKDRKSKSIYKKYRNYFIIKERETAHKAGARDKRKELIKRVKQ